MKSGNCTNRVASNGPYYGQQPPAVSYSDRTVSLFVVNLLEIQIQWIVVQQFLELARSHIVFCQMGYVRPIPIKFDSTAHSVKV